MPGKEPAEPDPSRSRTFIGEGVWDAAALEQALTAVAERRAQRTAAVAVPKAPPVPTGAPTRRADPADPVDTIATVNLVKPVEFPWPGSDVPSPARAATQRRSALGALAVFAVVAAVGTTAYLLLGHNDTKPPTSSAASNAGPAVVPSSATASEQDTPATAETDLTAPDTSSDIPSDTPSDAGTGTALTDPAQVVLAYFAAINNHDYSTAWTLGGVNLSTDYATFVAGFQNTSNDTATAQDADATTVEVQLTATNNDGTVQHYSGTYTVVAGVITNADMQSVG